jgi:chromosome segregation ATPase
VVEALFMIEPIMFFAIGFLVASLIALITMPLVHGRAVRLTTRRLEASTPLSMAEIQADKDQLRAEFAMSTRRLEMSVEELKAKTTGQLAELGKKADAINRLKLELGEKTATIFALEARDRALRDQLHTTEDEFALKTDALREAERNLADNQAKLANLSSDLDGRSLTSDSQRVEIVALQTHIEMLKDRIAGLEREVRDTENRLSRERLDAEAAAKELSAERGKVENLGRRVAQLEAQLVAQTTEAETLSRRVADLEARMAAQSLLLAERDHERDRLRLELEASQRVEGELRRDFANVDRRHADATEALRNEKAQLEAQLERARDDRTKLQRELAALKREAEATWASERVENALLRERINDVAAEVARLTAVLEGPNSPIDTILADEARASGNGAKSPALTRQATAAAGDAKGTLADRIRALQSRASRLSSAT